MACAVQDCITQLTELLLEADGDPLSPPAQQVGQVMCDWELVVGSKRLYNHRSTREIFSASSSVLQTIADVEPDQVHCEILWCFMLLEVTLVVPANLIARSSTLSC